MIITFLLLSNLSESTEIVKKNKLVKICCLYPLVGPGGLYARDSLEAIKIAEDDIKRNWPSSDFEFEIIIGDTRSKTLRAVLIARNFINIENIDFLCGVFSSKIALSVTEIAIKKN